MTQTLDKVMAETNAANTGKPADIQRRPARRTPVGGPRSVLKMNKNPDPNSVFRVVNDVGDRVESFKEMGYEVVTDPTIRIGDRRAGKVGSVGTPIEVSVGQGTKAVLMKQRKDYYEEDQKAKQEQVNSDESSMYQRARKEDSDYGKLKVSEKD